MSKTLPSLPTTCLALMASGTIHYERDWMDSPETRDQSLIDPTYRVSMRTPSPAGRNLDVPVFIAAHGFTGSTYEWEELREYAESRGTALVSLVLLGGHGTSIEDFKGSGWRDWQKPIIDEYDALCSQGYRNISFIGSSTGATLILEAVMSGRLATDGRLKHLVFIDPFIIPTARSLYLVRLVSLFVGNIPYKGASAEEKRHFYTNRPASTLIQLESLIRGIQKRLRKGYTLPPGVSLTVYKARVDDSADPESAVILGRHVKGAAGEQPRIHMVDSSTHVFTRLKGRASVTQADKDLQVRTFDEILAAV
jgi:carboxylesterase